MCLGAVDALFDDKRIVSTVLICWLSLVLVVFKEIGVLDSNFMNLGPSIHTQFMGIQLDTWYKWGLVAAFTFINTSINDFMSDALSPWILNTITDHKTRYIPYTKFTCLMVTQVWSMYCNLMGVFSIFLAMSQIDFVLIRMLADLIVNAYTTSKFLRDKTFCPEPVGKGKQAGEGGEEGRDSGGTTEEIEMIPLRKADGGMKEAGRGTEGGEDYTATAKV